MVIFLINDSCKLLNMLSFIFMICLDYLTGYPDLMISLKLLNLLSLLPNAKIFTHAQQHLQALSGMFKMQ